MVVSFKMLLLNTTYSRLQPKVYHDVEFHFVVSDDDLAEHFGEVEEQLLDNLCFVSAVESSCILLVSATVLYQHQLNLLSLYHLENSAASNESTRVTWLWMRTLWGWWWYKLTLYMVIMVAMMMIGEDGNDNDDAEPHPPYMKWFSQVDEQVCSCKWPGFCHHHQYQHQYHHY